MEQSIYSFSLCTALPLMLFFGFYFLFAKTPEKKIFKNYLRSRQIMGIAMLLLSANYSVHFFFGIRFKNADSAILMNMSTYFLCYSLFSSALIMLLDCFYITKRRVWTHIILWIIFSTLSGQDRQSGPIKKCINSNISCRFSPGWYWWGVPFVRWGFN